MPLFGVVDPPRPVAGDAQLVDVGRLEALAAQRLHRETPDLSNRLHVATVVNAGERTIAGRRPMSHGDDRSLVGLLGEDQPMVGLLDQVDEFDHPSTGPGDADRDAEPIGPGVSAPAGEKSLLHPLEQHLGVPLGQVPQHDDELIAAESCDQVV